MRKKIALIVGAIFVSSLLILLVVNEVYGLVPSVQFGLVREKRVVDLDRFEGFNVSERSDEVVLLCYVWIYEDPSLKLYCFNNTNDEFEEIDLNLEENGEAKELFDEEALYQEAFSLIRISRWTGEWFFGSTQVDYDSKFVEILSNLSIESFVLGEDSEIGMLYVNFYDYIHSKVALLKYYESVDSQDNIDLVVEEISDFVDNYSENGYSLLYPIDRLDIEYIAQIDKELAGRIDEISAVLVDYIYQDFKYQFNHSNTVDELLYVNGGKLCKALLFINGNDELESKYLPTFEGFREDLLTQVNISQEKLDFLIKYMPVVDVPLLNYFNRISEDTERLDNELSTMLYYVCNNMDCSSNISISNMLLKGKE